MSSSSHRSAPAIARPALSIVAAGLVAIAGAGCTDGSQPQPTFTPEPAPPAPPAACDVVPAADAATALGQETPPVPVVDTAQECRYPAGNGVDSVAVRIRPEEHDAATEEAAIALLGAEKTTRVTDLGDAALVYDIGHQVQYHVWVDGVYLLVALTRVDGTDLTDPARTLADAAVARVAATADGLGTS